MPAKPNRCTKGGNPLCEFGGINADAKTVCRGGLATERQETGNGRTETGQGSHWPSVESAGEVSAIAGRIQYAYTGHLRRLREPFGGGIGFGPHPENEEKMRIFWGGAKKIRFRLADLTQAQLHSPTTPSVRSQSVIFRFYSRKKMATLLVLLHHLGAQSIALPFPRIFPHRPLTHTPSNHLSLPQPRSLRPAAAENKQAKRTDSLRPWQL